MIKESNTVEEAIKERLAGLFDKRRASGDSQPCDPRDIAPIHEKVFNIGPIIRVSGHFLYPGQEISCFEHLPQSTRPVTLNNSNNLPEEKQLNFAILSIHKSSKPASFTYKRTDKEKYMKEDSHERKWAWKQRNIRGGNYIQCIEYTQSRIPMKKVCAEDYIKIGMGLQEERRLHFIQQGLDRGDYKKRGTADISRRNTYGRVETERLENNSYDINETQLCR